MKKLFILEFKKIAKKRMNIVVVAVCLLLIVFLFTLPVKQYIVLDTNGNQMTGKRAIEQEREYENIYAGILTDEKIAEDIAAYQELFNNPANLSLDSDTKALNKDAYYRYFFPYLDYWTLINGNYTAPYTYDTSYSAVTNMDIDSRMDFYSSRDEKVDRILNQSYLDWNFSENEKAFWRERISSIEIPYEYSYHQGWEMLSSCMELFVVGIIGICICVSGVFSGEYQSGADSIILSSRYGKSKLFTAKILAAFAFSGLVFTLFIVVGCGIQLAAFGFDGWNLPVQVLNSITPYTITLSGAVLTVILTQYLVLLGMVSFTLFLSARIKSSIPVLVAVFFIMMLPVFVGISETNGIWNRILVLLPYRAAQQVFSDDFYAYFGYPISGLTFDVVTIRIIAYAVITFVCLPFARRKWKRHQVG